MVVFLFSLILNEAYLQIKIKKGIYRAPDLDLNFRESIYNFYMNRLIEINIAEFLMFGLMFIIIELTILYVIEYIKIIFKA